MIEIALLAIAILVITLTLGVPLPYCFGAALMVMYFIGVDLSRFDAAPLIAFTAPKETDYGTETDGRIPPRCGAYRTDEWADAQA
ncbi:MAG: hypothetical protein ACU0BP_05070, partial [Sulfitobacter sp.]